MKLNTFYFSFLIFLAVQHDYCFSSSMEEDDLEPKSMSISYEDSDNKTFINGAQYTVINNPAYGVGVHDEDDEDDAIELSDSDEKMAFFESQKDREDLGFTFRDAEDLFRTTNASADAAEIACSSFEEQMYGEAITSFLQAVQVQTFPQSAANFYNRIKNYYTTSSENRDSRRNAVSAYLFGLCYEYGYGIWPDLAYAKQLYEEAIGEEFPTVQDSLARLNSKIENNK